MSDIEKSSRTWGAVSEWAKAQIAEAQSALETPGLDLAGTEHVRGRIAGLRDLLALAEPRQTVIPKADTYGR